MLVASARSPRVRRALTTLAVLAVVIRTSLCAAAPPDLRSNVPPMHPPPWADIPMRADWRYERTPNFCKTLVTDPRPALHNCSRRNGHMQCADGSYQLFSQMHQDYYVYTRHFAALRRRGIYLDVAANEPVGLSNTYFMDECLGWSGLCVEAQPALVAKLYEARSCAIVPTCVSDRARTVSFAMLGGLSGVVDTNKNKAQMSDSHGVMTMRMRCTTLEFALAKHKVTNIDYLSLDVEGHELHVLKGIDWDSVVINVMTVETQRDTKDEVEAFLVSKGYKRHWPDDYDERSKRTGQLWEDMIFLHKSVTFGKPV